MGTPVDDAALDSIFRVARTQNKWLDKPVSNEQLLALYELMRWGPTSANSFPVRLVFVTSKGAKERLQPLLLEGNRQKVMTAPATAIIGYDTRFYEWLPAAFSPCRRPSLVRRQARVRGDDRLSQQQPAGGLSHHRGARPRARLRPDVRLRQRGRGPGVLPGRPDQVELHLRDRLWRPGGGARAPAAAGVQRGLLDRIAAGIPCTEDGDHGLPYAVAPSGRARATIRDRNTSSDEQVMPAGKRRDRELIEKIRSLPADRVMEVEDFVDFLRQREEERRLARAVARRFGGGIREGLGQPGRCRV